MAAGVIVAVAVVIYLGFESGPHASTRGGPAAASRPVGDPEGVPGANLPQPASREEARIAGQADDPRAAVLRGRCVDAATRAPLAGVTVTVEDTYPWAGPKDLPPQQTGNDGTFRFALRPPPKARCSLTARRGGLLPTGETLITFEVPEVDLGDLPMVAVQGVTGTLTDSRGRRLAGATVSFQPHEQLERADLNVRVETAADGTFRLDPGIVPGRYSLWITQWLLKEPREVQIREAHADALEVVAWADDDLEAIDGVVVDEHDQPVAELVLNLSPGVPGRLERVHTDAQGGFRITRTPAEPRAAQWLQPSHPAGYVLAAGVTPIEWGSHALKLRVRQLAEVEVVVTDALTGERVRRFRSQWFLDPNGERRIGNWEMSQWNVDDPPDAKRFRLNPGKYLLAVQADDDKRHPHPAVRHFEVTDDLVPRLEIALQPTVEQRVRVVRAGGEPVAGTKLTLACTTERMQDPCASSFLRILETETDANGEVTLAGPAATRLALAIRGPGHLPMQVDDLYLGQRTEPFLVGEGATLRVRVTPTAALALVRPFAGEVTGRPRLQLFRFDPNAWVHDLRLMQSDGTVRLFPEDVRLGGAFAADGTAELRGVPPGTWDVVLRFDERPLDASGSRCHVVATGLEFTGGQSRHLDLDLAYLAPGQLEAQVFVDGRPLAHAAVFLHGAEPAAAGAHEIDWLAVRTDAEGRFTTRLPAGSWRAGIRPWRYVPTLTGPGFWSAQTVSTTSGATVRGVFHLRTQRLRLAVVDSAGRPGAGRLIVTARDPCSYREVLHLHEAGTAELFPAPPFPIAVAWQPGIGDTRALGVVTMPSDRDEAAFTLRVPR